MIYRILYATDLHKKMKDITTIRGYCNVCNKIEEDLIQLCKELEITHFVSGGDWFDSGYGSDVAAALAHTDIDRILYEAVNGNFYGVIGNHIRLNMDSNPELFLIQPHPKYTTRHNITRKEQIIKTPDELFLNGVQISFCHHDKTAESAASYKRRRKPEAKYHIGLYHTEMVIPTVHLHRMGMTTVMNENSAIFQALDGVDLAIVGHVHKPIGTFRIDKSDGSATTMIVPGSLTNTDAGLISRHTTCDLPIIEIGEEGQVTISYHTLDLRTNEVTFLKKEIDAAKKEKLRSLRGNNKESLYEELEYTSFVGAKAEGFVTLNSFMKEQGYTQSDKNLVKMVISSPENISEMIKVHQSETTVELE